MLYPFEFILNIENSNVELLKTWIEFQEFSKNRNNIVECTYNVALSQIIWSHILPRNEETRFFKIIDQMLPDSTYVSVIKNYVHHLNPTRLGLDIYIDDRSSQIGYSIYPSCEMQDYVKLEHQNPFFLKILPWLEQAQNLVLFKVSKSMLSQDQETEIQFAFKNCTLSDQLTACERLFDQLGYTWIGSSIEKILNYHKIKNVGLIIHFTTEGILRIGIKIFNPSRIFMLFMASLNKKSSDQNLAIMEGILNANGPEYLSYCMENEGWVSELNYIVADA